MVWAAQILMLLIGAVATPVSSLPSIDVTLTPFLNDEGSVHIDGKLVLHSTLEGNDSLIVLPLTIANAPSARYTNETLFARDSTGPLGLTILDDTGPSGLPSRFWTPTRPVNGPVTVQFTASPRQVNSSTNVGPLFDLRQNSNGLLGSIWAIVPAPPSETTEFNVSLSWNLTQSPAETRAMWTWGEGPEPVNFVDTTDRLLYTFFSVGDLSSYPTVSTSGGNYSVETDFSMHWLQDPPFNATSVAKYIEEYFEYSAEFWQDDGSEPYTVFVRHNDDSGSGGTALYRSFMFGWHDENSTTDSGLKYLLAHEITHNWPTVTDTNSEASTYAEGMAEYYSLRLLWRQGLINITQYSDAVNERMETYYTNSVVNMTNEEAYDIAWDNRDGQRIPYGRGMIYLFNLDQQLRTISNGTKSLDNIAVGMLNLCRNNQVNCLSTKWLDLIEENLGSSARDEYDTMASGTPLIRPLDGSLGPCFDVVQTSEYPVIYQFAKRQNVSDTECLI